MGSSSAPKRAPRSGAPCSAMPVDNGDQQVSIEEDRRRKVFTNLEVARFVSAFGVLVWHYQHFSFTGGETGLLDPHEQPMFFLLKPFFLYGFYGVEFFWTLSGFIFFVTYSEKLRRGQVGAAQFSILRLSRLYPLHLLTALFVFLAQPLYVALNANRESFVYQHNTLWDLFLNLALVSHWRPLSNYSLNGPFWSVSVEIFVYIAFYILVRYLPRTGLSAPLVAILGWALAVGLELSHLYFVPNILLAFNLFFTGGVIYQIYRWASNLASVHLNLVRGAAFLALAASVGAVVMYVDLAEAVDQLHRLVLYSSFGLTVLALSLVPQVQGRLGRIGAVLGSTTYASYLVHFPVQLTMAIAFSAVGAAIPWSDWRFMILWMATVYIASIWSYRRIELPFQVAIRRRFMSPRPVRAGRTSEMA
jgi:peptidoglycan/LPS O-acetylase OafA/YrhL